MSVYDTYYALSFYRPTDCESVFRYTGPEKTQYGICIQKRGSFSKCVYLTSSMTGRETAKSLLLGEKFGLDRVSYAVRFTE